MSNKRSILIIAIEACATFLCALFITAPALAQQPSGAGNQRQVSRVKARTAFPWPLMAAPASLTPAAGSNLQVIGGGTIGRLTKWTGFTGTNSVIGDTTIFEDKSGNVGIGTDSPTSKLTVNGTIQASGGSSVLHDPTLTGNGTGVSPLGVAVPLILSGSVDNGNGVITVTNVAAGAPGIFGVGGNSSPTIGGGSGLIALGGSGNAAPGGAGLVGFGGNATGGSGGTGGSLIGGVGSNGGNGGDGLFAVGALGTGAGKKGGRGIVAIAGGGASGATAGLAGDFVGDVSISGNLSKGGGSFKIDHPIDPANKYLYHSFVESPDMMNVYNGIIILDAGGEATVELPEWFGALNRDFRYLLTPVGAPAPTLYIAEEVSDNHFKIAGGSPRMKVSWQVTGIRQDAWANAHRIPVEQEKPADERGYYLHPELFGQPEQKGIQWSRDREVMQRIKDARDESMPPQPAVKQ